MRRKKLNTPYQGAYRQAFGAGYACMRLLATLDKPDGTINEMAQLVEATRRFYDVLKIYGQMPEGSSLMYLAEMELAQLKKGIPKAKWKMLTQAALQSMLQQANTKRRQPK